ncbi:MAG: hypothetical protein WC317_05670 [Candidatus Omnitrophota bacterium]|jgi:hypothetical protein
MKKIIFFCIVLLLLVLFSPAVFAVEMWPFDSSLSTNSVWQFDLGQKPSIYVNLPEPVEQGLWTSKVFSDWKIGTTLKGEDNQEGLYFRQEYQLDLPSTFNWSDKSNVGTWNVVVDYGYYRLGSTEYFRSGIAYTSFNIIDPNPNTAPEPVATVLFLAGGATLAVRRLRKK